MKLIPLLIGLVFILAACQGQTTTSGDINDPRTGTDGIILSISPGSPPSIVTEGEEFSIQLNVENKGAWPNEGADSTFAGCLYLDGLDPDFATITDFELCTINARHFSKDIPSNLFGKDQFDRIGSSEFVEFPLKFDKAPSQDGEFNQKFLVTACYKYHTIATPTVCIDPNPFSENVGNKVCDVNVVGDVGGGQGGPVAVTYVKPTATSTKLQWEIGISNQGNGVLLKDEGDFGNCPTPKIADTDWVDFIVTLGTDEDPLICKPGRVSTQDFKTTRLFEGSGAITCTKTYDDEEKTSAAFTTPLKIELKYNYQTAINGQFTVVPK